MWQLEGPQFSVEESVRSKRAPCGRGPNPEVCSEDQRKSRQNSEKKVKATSPDRALKSLSTFCIRPPNFMVLLSWTGWAGEGIGARAWHLLSMEGHGAQVRPLSRLDKGWWQPEYQL